MPTDRVRGKLHIVKHEGFVGMDSSYSVVFIHHGLSSGNPKSVKDWAAMKEMLTNLGLVVDRMNEAKTYAGSAEGCLLSDVEVTIDQLKRSGL